ncbi:MAG TPA: mechanosensitive ion channel family protein, partial [Methylomirabilota bacterium]|nr:mechanosensitive ion channel family protein [Methylomirabilota bacterium]
MEFLAQADAQGLTALFKREYLGIELWRYIASLAILLAGFTLRRVFETLILRGLVRLFSRTSLKYDEMVITALGRPLSAFILVSALHLAVTVLAIDIELQAFNLAETILISYQVAIGIIAIWAVYRLVDVLARYLDDLAAAKDSSLRGQFIPLIKQSLRIFTLLVGALTLLATLNVDVVGLLAGLGVGGIAIALAAQDSFGNFLGTLNILADRPFKVGDWIQMGDRVDGTIEEIGFRSTKVRTFAKTLISIPNRLLATEIVDNFSRMPKRRVKMTVGVTYQTTPEQMEELLARLRKLIATDPDINQELYLIRFTDFGASSLDILVYYFTITTAWDAHLAVRERINISIMRIIAELGLSIAYPTRTLHLES